MKLISLEVNKLFNVFDYLIPLDRQKVSFLTGPNGYGKTILLNILKSIIQGDLSLMKDLPFSNIRLTTSVALIEVFKSRTSLKVSITKDGVKTDKNIQLLGATSSSVHSYNTEVIKNEFTSKKRSEDDEKDRGYFLSKLSDLINENKGVEDKFIVNGLRKIFPNEFLFFIKAERLDSYDSDVSVVDNRAELLQRMIDDVNEESAAISLKLDSTFPARLLSALNVLKSPNRAFLRERLGTLQKRRKLYMESGLIESEYLADADYDNETLDSIEFYAVLDLHITDAFLKLEPLELLYDKIKLFESSIKDKVLAYKSIVTSKTSGFHFESTDGQIIDRNVLSSGEKNQIVILFDLIFNANNHKVVLIDEPENSLHVAWQQDFLKSLNKITTLNGFSQVLIATHSASIINQNWESTTDLYQQSQGK